MSPEQQLQQALEKGVKNHNRSQGSRQTSAIKSSLEHLWICGMDWALIQGHLILAAYAEGQQPKDPPSGCQLVQIEKIWRKN